MIEEELNKIGECAKRDALNAEEMNYLKLLLIKWMYEQGMLQ
jgi:hypothetical protein